MPVAFKIHLVVNGLTYCEKIHYIEKRNRAVRFKIHGSVVQPRIVNPEL